MQDGEPNASDAKETKPQNMNMKVRSGRGKRKQMLERFSDKETEEDGVNASFGMEKVCKKENIQQIKESCARR
ncbi:hypothetical protein N7541_000916 [Penicillium brevicompactum]|uniref:Uncharacterized protein n=1 Tax=Penicillium brevicompactum TaxID=5074 RepID=A0A9W9RWJ7_PENBR|nr:hypothetical protein N7541_000916 [Penicillium brevicompactum]